MEYYKVVRQYQTERVKELTCNAKIAFETFVADVEFNSNMTFAKYIESKKMSINEVRDIFISGYIAGYKID